LKTLLIDNFDSFTYNLYQLIAQVSGEAPVVYKNNEITWSQIVAQSIDTIVIGPGPGRPDRQSDFGGCAEILAKTNLPVLGVCLGMQGIACVAGGTIAYADRVMHGRMSMITHTGDPLFRGIPSSFQAVRYHSIVVSALPDSLEALAYSEDQVLMALRHKEKPVWGVQFHPESICTEYGAAILRNFFQLSGKNIPAPTVPISPPQPSFKRESLDNSGKEHKSASLQVFCRKLPILLDAELVYRQFFQASGYAFWLDSAITGEGARFSYMGDASGPRSEVVFYDVQTGNVSTHSDNAVTETCEDIFAFLDRRLGNNAMPAEDLPFDFQSGYVGYFGYETKADCGYSQVHPSHYPDAFFILADRFIVVDHADKALYLLCIDHPNYRERAETWLQQSEQQLYKLTDCEPNPLLRLQPKDAKAPSACKFDQEKADYLSAIARAKHWISQGESYELCLTNRLTCKSFSQPLKMYSMLRQLNPAPYACYLQTPEFQVLCSSPEKFLTINRERRIETKPIKGTRKRGVSLEEDNQLIEDLLNSEKDRAENLMIVDLLRNDLGQVAEVGSVNVEKLFAVESFASVHQLVSTISARLSDNKRAIDCVRACFPGGSMTGAPKKRSLELLDQLETRARGIYSGSIGFLGFNGCVDLNIVIRTLIVSKTCAEIGVGGAIVDLSEAESEWNEILVKAKALLDALALAEQSAEVLPTAKQPKYQ